MHFGYNCLTLLNSIYRQAPGNRKGVCSAELGPSQKPKGSMQRWISMPVRDFCIRMFLCLIPFILYVYDVNERDIRVTRHRVRVRYDEMDIE